MQFFVPQAKKRDYETTYEGLIDIAKDQLRWPVTSRKIFRIEYISHKKPFIAEVGRLAPAEHRYEIVAILDSTVYLVVTKAIDGGPGITILVDKSDVTSVIEFD